MTFSILVSTMSSRLHVLVTSANGVVDWVVKSSPRARCAVTRGFVDLSVSAERKLADDWLRGDTLICGALFRLAPHRWLWGRVLGHQGHR